MTFPALFRFANPAALHGMPTVAALLADGWEARGRDRWGNVLMRKAVDDVHPGRALDGDGAGVCGADRGDDSGGAAAGSEGEGMTPQVMSPGRDLDVLVAEKVLGIKVVFPLLAGREYREAKGDEARDLRFPYYVPSGKPWRTHGRCDGATLPFFSTDIADAWMVVAEFQRGWRNKKAAAAIDLHISDCCAEEDCFCKIKAPDIRDVMAGGTTMPMAICKAALLVAGYSIVEEAAP
jgi:hypothetical protein